MSSHTPSNLKATPPAADPALPIPADDEHGFGVVGLCASAGGLEALQAFFDAMPDDNGLAFVVVPHLSPDRQSLMTELLASHTGMPVSEATDGAVVRPSQVYVIPPGRLLTIRDGVLHLAPAAHGDAQPATERQGAIDLFLRSLAADRQQRAVGIVLSGTGASGTAGLREIKQQGGLTLAQDPASAAFDAMPRSAITAGVVDQVLPPGALAKGVLEAARHLRASGAWRQSSPGEEELAQLAGIVALLRRRTKYDFRPYRRAMLLRRARRRMGLAHQTGLAAYLDYLRGNPDEVQRLTNDLLIGVTSFFRDPPAFELLRQRVLEPLIEGASPNWPVRVWVPGCASGEEAYSIAMLLLEGFERRRRAPSLQIFATDIDETALEVARAGVYPRGIEADVGAERLQRFFVDADTEHCRVKKRLRECVVFAPQSLIGDAPFSRLDLISCRNLLIYLEPQVQQRIIALFHFALREGGYLLLGPSESAGRQSALFETVSKQWRLFRRLGEARREVLYFPPAMLPGHRPEPPEAAIDDSRARRRLGAAAQQLLLDEYGPAAVLLSRQLEILYLFGPTADYLQLPPGQPTLYLLDMLEEPLRTRVRAACHRALQDQRTVVVSDGRPNPGGTDPGGTTRRVEIRVRALQEPTPLSGLLLISFADLDAAPVPPAAEARAEPAAADEDQPALRQLERELEATREDLQSSVEELKASNEETMSMNEELQSANEELETSKEELQSLNEELITLNAQLREKVRELEHSNNDINNLLASTDIATVFLDTRMRIKRFTPACARLLSLRGTDLGRPLSDLALRVRDPKLHSDAERVLERLTPLEVEVDGADGSRYLRRVQPYRTQDNRIQGVVITFVDITERSRAVAAVRDSEERFRMLFERSPMCLMEQDWSGVLQCLRALCGADADSDLRTWVRAHAEQAVFCRGRVRINAINHAALALLGAGSAEQVVAASQRFLPLLPADQLLGLLDALLQGRGGVQEFQVERLDGGHIPVLLHAVPARGSEHALERVLVALIDISQRKVIEQQLAEREQRLSAILNTVADGVIGVDREGVIGELNATAQRLFGVSAAEAVGQPLTRFLRPGPPIGDNGRGIMEQLRTQGDGPPRTQLCEGVHANGDLFPAEMVGAEIDHVGLYVLLVRDISRRRELERQIIEISTREQERIGQEIHDGLGQQLTAVTLLASALAARLEKGERPEAAQARQLADQLAHALTDSRGITQGLAPVGVAPERLRDALVNLADQVQRATGITCRLEADEQTPISDPVLSAHLYRIAQEATNNAARHGKPTRIEIRLHVQDATLCLDVEDDGQWREAPQDGPGGLGLHIMGYRAGIVGGTLTVSPQPEGGTLMCCRIPLRTR